MATKAAFLAAFLLVLVAGDLAHGHTVPPLRRGTRSHDWMQGKKGGPPSGMQPSDAAAAHLRAISSMQKGVEEGKFVAPVPGFKLPPLPPNAA
ncbi:hypothetical protein ZWY2020_023431 [Hordeum vulgare]|nr:hypothetical protein ZWY2020_023431 [Hordeum vulgare]